MITVVAAFTLAHSLTLALCVFGIVRLPSLIVEPVIALSIISVALENILRPQRTHSRARLAVAFRFGLIHGLGFAGGLLDAMCGLPSAGTWIALAAFSGGVEIGHQAIILPLFGLIIMSRRKLPRGLHPQSLRCGSTFISVCGAYYLIIALRQSGPSSRYSARKARSGAGMDPAFKIPMDHPQRKMHHPRPKPQKVPPTGLEPVRP